MRGFVGSKYQYNATGAVVTVVKSTSTMVTLMNEYGYEWKMKINRFRVLYTKAEG